MNIKRILGYKNIAVVGCSRDEGKDAHKVPRYLKEHGYHIIPINPYADEILSEECYSSLLDIPEEFQKSVEVVDIFRPSKDVLPIVEQAIELRRKHGNLKAVWMQLGIVNEEASALAKEAGLVVIMDKCMKIEHQHIHL